MMYIYNINHAQNAIRTGERMALSRLQIAKKNILAELAKAGDKVLMIKDLREILSRNRQVWNLAQATTTQDFIAFLEEKGGLRSWRLDFPFRPETRFTWGDSSVFRVIAALKPKGYFSHYTALYHHGLTEQIPKTIYLNSEQQLKSPGSLSVSLEQARIDRAYRGKPRQSSSTANIGDLTVCLISGKNTGNLGVITAQGGDLGGFPVTDLERTMLDATVRPFYAGGPFEIMKAYEHARGMLSTNRLASLLKKIDLIYPYHQAIGFYLEMSGYPEKSWSQFLTMGLDFDFYLAYQLSQPEYSKRWRIYYPKGLKGGT